MGAAYHQLRSNEFQPGCVRIGSKYEPSPTILPATRRIPCARRESAIASTTVHVESQPPGASVSTVVAALRPRRITAAIQDEVALQHAVGDGAVGIDARARAIIDGE